MSHSVILAIAVTVVWLASVASADPRYFAVYKETFPETAFPLPQHAKCNICHTRESKHNLSEYGLKLHKELGEKRTRDVDAIREALLKIGPVTGMPEPPVIPPLRDSGR